MRRTTKLLFLGLITMTLAACGDDSGQEECSPANAEVLEGKVNAEQVTLSQCTVVTERVQVIEGGRVDIVPGSTLFFEQGAGFWVRDDSALNAVGTADEPILFTGTQQQAGHWRNIQLNGANSADNAIEYATIEYAGRDGESAVHVEDDSALILRNTTIQNSGGAGFDLREGVEVLPAVTFEDNTVTGNVLAGMAGPMAAGQIAASNELTGNETDWIEIDGPGNASDIVQSTTFQNIGIPFYFTESVGVKNNATWTLEAGVEILAPANGRFVINDDGALTANGTAEAPVTFRGVEDGAGFWKHVYFEKSPSPNNLLENTVIAGAGGGGDNDSAALHLQSGRDATVAVDFNGVTIRDSAGFGVIAKEGNNGTIEVSGCETLTFENIANANIEGPICQ